MSKKSGLFCLGLGIVAGYAICKYGESVSNTVKAKLEKKSVEDLAEEIKDTLATGKDDFAEYLRDLKKKTYGYKEEVEEEDVEVIEVTKAGEETSTVVESENNIESVEDLDNKFNEIVHEMNKDTYKVLDALKKEKDAPVEEVKEDKEASKPKTTRKRKPAQKKEIKIEDAE